MVSTRRSRSATQSPERSEKDAVQPEHETTPQSQSKAPGRRSTRQAASKTAVKQLIETIDEAGELPDNTRERDEDTERPGGVHRPVFDASSDDDDDDELLLGGCNAEQLTASIRHALQTNRRQAVGSSDMHAAATEDHDTVDRDDESGTSSEGEDGEEAAGKKGGKTGQANGRMMHWRPTVAVPQLQSTRLVHQREPEKVEKEDGLSKKLLVPPRDTQQLSKAARKAAPDTAGQSWYNMPATRIDDDMKRELRLLRLRGAFDPKRFYKSDVTKLPKYFQMGTVVDSAVDFYGGRLTNAERKGTLTEQLLADQQLTQARKKRFNKLQDAAQKYAPKKNRKSDKKRVKKNIKHTSR